MADRTRILDLLIIGGGINGAGIARDAAGRGLKVALFEQHDLGQHSSSASTKLLHWETACTGGRRFRAPREALAERERLLRIAPHLIRPLEFLQPQAKEDDPAPAFRNVFDNFGTQKSLPGLRNVALGKHTAAGVLQPAYVKAVGFTDCWVDDSRLVILNAMDAAARGAKIFPRTKIISATPEDGLWKAETGRQSFHARAIVNAAGPWAAEVLNVNLGRNTPSRIRVVKGSHIITKKLYAESHGIILRSKDQRPVFVIPYERDFSLIGSTAIPHEPGPAPVTISEDETIYLCDTVNHYFKSAITPEDVIWTYSGLRPEIESPPNGSAKNGSDYQLDLDEGATPPLLSIYGGRLATYRKLAEQALEKILPAIGRPPGRTWTAAEALPGGDIEDLAGFAHLFRAFNTHLDGATARRLATSYGTRVKEFVQPNMGHDFGAGLTRAEVDYLVRHEWARTTEDILWRRTKLGLHIPADTEPRLAAYLARDRMEG
jgi:glycerol-3-phosphate dehydrogenase